jgi:hypothetical protein
VALATGKLKGTDMFGVKADLSALWAEAAGRKIENQITPGISTSVEDVVQVMEMGMKDGPLELKRLIERKAEALEFRLGHGGYYGPAIQAYLGFIMHPIDGGFADHEGRRLQAVLTPPECRR